MIGRRALFIAMAAIGAACSVVPPPVAHLPLALTTPVAPVPSVEIADLRLADVRAVEPAQSSQALFDPELAPAPASAESPRLGLDASSIDLPVGRSIVEVEVPNASLVSLGVFGAPDALLDFDLVGSGVAKVVRTHGALDEDGLLPRVVSFATGGDASEPGETITVIVEVTDPVKLERVAVDPRSLAGSRDETSARPLIGLPAPASREDGYLLGRAGRYAFARADVTLTLLSVLKRTRQHYRRDPIVITDISQWNGLGPALDLGNPRHKSHSGGRDIDIALPANDGPSTLRLHCKGDGTAHELHHCLAGSVTGVDAARLAFMLGLFVEIPGRIEAIFLDDAIIEKVRAAADLLRNQGVMGASVAATLSDDKVLHHEPWHTDHVHVRFTGERGRVPW